MFQEDVHAFPERVVEDLDHLLVGEGIIGEGLDGIRTRDAGEGKGQRIFSLGKLQSAANLIVSFGRSESHYDVFGMKNCLKPWAEEHGNIESWEGALAYDYGMNKFY